MGVCADPPRTLNPPWIPRNQATSWGRGKREGGVALDLGVAGREERRTAGALRGSEGAVEAQSSLVTLCLSFV